MVIKADEENFGFITHNSIENRKAIISIERKRLDLLFRTMMTFLNALKRDADHDTIYWPNRAEEIEQLIEKLSNIGYGHE